jgi:hypothetical protein
MIEGCQITLKYTRSYKLKKQYMNESYHNMPVKDVFIKRKYLN